MEEITDGTVEDNSSAKSVDQMDEYENGSEVKEGLPDDDKVSSELFKKPQLIIGPRRGKPVGKLKSLGSTPSQDSNESKEKDDVETSDINTKVSEDEVADQNSDVKCYCNTSPAQKMKENSIPLPYREPKWGGLPNGGYSFEVLKEGKIILKCDLGAKSFYVFGRLTTSDFHMTHPTISRHHAVLQYRSQESEDSPRGFYIYDLGSTHGTFLNKYRIKPNMYVRVQVGHMLKLGCSSRMFVLVGPEDDMEEESELTVTQLKEKRQLELAKRELEKLEEQRLEEEKTKKEDEEGIDWGMSEDADEETDLTENPFATTQNEELYINDPKKTLRGWFEREGYELEYDVEEKGFGQFLCRVELPIESSRGSTMVAETLVKGKKKEAVVQCALEACRMLDRYGVLRQATHESKKRKAKDWEAEDFYDSDEDTFLDRTGTVEKKRQQRMKAAGKKDPEEVVETYESLMKKHSEVLVKLQDLELELHKASKDFKNATKTQDDNEEEDALDAFMMELSKPAPDKKHITRIKSQLAALKQEEIQLRKLVNIAKPASLPELKPPEPPVPHLTETGSNKKVLPLVGVRKRPSNKAKQVTAPENFTHESTLETGSEEEDDEEDSEKEEIRPPIKTSGDNSAEREIMETDNSASKMKTKFFGPAMLPPDKEVEVTEPEVVPKKKSRSKPKQLRHEKANQSKSEYDPMDPDYSTWVPPEGQSGDGKTKLNEKYGY